MIPYQLRPRTPPLSDPDVSEILLADTAHLCLHNPFELKRVREEAFHKEMRRLNSHRAIAVCVSPAAPCSSTYPDPPTIAAPQFKPFSFPVPAEIKMADIVLIVWGRLPNADMQAVGGRHNLFIGGRDINGSDCPWELIGPVSQALEEDNEVLEIQVGLEVVPVIERRPVAERKERKDRKRERENGLKRVWRRIGPF